MHRAVDGAGGRAQGGRTRAPSARRALALSGEPAPAAAAARGPVLTAFYDLAAAPTSFDCATFLALADLHRLKHGYAAFEVAFVPAEGKGYWEDAPFPAAERSQRLHNLLLPLTQLWPACAAARLLATRAEAGALRRRIGRHHYPRRYRADAPVADSFQWANIVAARACGETIAPWRAPAGARATVERWLAAHAGARRPIVITLREASYRSERNSNLAAWGEFARGLDEERYCPIIVRDTETAASPPPPALASLPLFPEASLDVTVRAALYERSWLSLMSATGPMMLLWLNRDCRSLAFGLLDLRHPTASPVALRALGIEIGRQMPGLGAGHRILWQPDSVDAIRTAFAAATAAIEEGRPITADAEPESPLRIARRLRESGAFFPARRIYAHEALSRQHRAAALCGLSLTELEIKRRFRLYRLCRGGLFYAAALAAGLGRAESIDEAIEIARCLERWRRPQAAERLYRAMLARAPQEPMALHRLGLLARTAGREAEALRLLEAAVAADPYSGQYRLDLGEMLAALGRKEDALVQYRAAFACHPFHEGVPRRLGR